VIFNHFLNLFQRKVCLTLFVSITLYSCGYSGNTSPENETLPSQESEVIAPPEPEIITFVDITESSGLLHEHSTIEEENVDLFSGGLALGDVNKDGLTDIYAVGGDAGTNALFLNHGALRFEKDSVLTGLLAQFPDHQQAKVLVSIQAICSMKTQAMAALSIPRK
jgi:hypothetical protein